MQTILEIKEKLLCGSRLQFECELLERDKRQAVVLYRLPKAGDLHGVHLPEGALSVGYFWQDRAYNVYHFVAAGGETLALYINISDSTRIDETRLYWRDLVLDILIRPDGECQVLDEEEIPAGIDITLLRYIQVNKAQLLAAPQNLLQEIESRSRQLLQSR